MFFLSPDKNCDVSVCLLMTSLKSCLFGNEQTETGCFGPDSLNPFSPCGKTFQLDLNQTREQDNLRLKQGGMCFGNMVYAMVG